MKPNIIKTLALAFLWLASAFTAQAKINVVATLPDFGAIAREIGGDNVDVTVLAKPTEDPHFVDARPSFVVKLRQADVLIDGGAELEIGWLPPLLQNARNPKIEVGPTRARAGVAGDSLDGGAGAIDPRGGRRARDGQSAFHGRSDHRQGRRATYRERFRRGRSSARRRLPDERKEIRSDDQRQAPGMGGEAAARSTGKASSPITIPGPTSRIVLAFNIDVFLEPKPGIPPSPSHLAEVIEQMKAQKIKAIIVEPYHNRKIAEKVAQSTGAKVVDFAQFPGALPNTDTYVKLIDALVNNLAAALK